MSTHVVVAGHLVVAPDLRAEYLSGCVEVVRVARDAAGCLDFAISEDLLDASGINVFERWESQDAVDASRGSRPSQEQAAALSSASGGGVRRVRTTFPQLIRTLLTVPRKAPQMNSSKWHPDNSQQVQLLFQTSGFPTAATGHYGVVTRLRAAPD
jgi:quinol monooxygenase YgiN